MLWTHVKKSFHVPRCHALHLSVSILEAKEIQNLSWLLEMMKIRWDYLVINCATLNCCNETDWQVYRGNSSQLSSWKMLRSISGLQDMSILLKSTWFQSSQEYATHQSSTALNVHSEDHQMKEQKYPTRSRKYLNLQSQLQYFPYIITLLPFKHKNKKSLRTLT